MIQFVELVNDPQCRAIGEIGLEYSSHGHGQRHMQRKNLEVLLQASQHTNLPVVIHCRSNPKEDCSVVHEDCICILQMYLDSTHPIHVHCFSASDHIVQRWLECFPNVKFGVSGILLNARKPEKQILRTAISMIPLDSIMLESDSPYLDPHEQGQSQKEDMNHPWNLRDIAEEVSRLTHVSHMIVLEAARINASRFYHL